MLNFRQIFSLIAIALTFIGFYPYIRDVIKNKSVPHIYSWILGTFATSLIFALQFTAHAGPGAFVMLATALLCGTVLVLSLLKKGKRDIVQSDTIFFILAIIALFLWIVAKQPILSTILITLTDLFGFIPTVRKTWKKPYTETMSFYCITTLRYLFVLLAIERYGIVTALYPITWLFINALFVLMLIVRRREIAE